jgi:fructose-bisphosphate aldolase, class II
MVVPWNPKSGGDEAMKGLHDVLADAERRNVAVGHFNISELVALKAVMTAARELRVPVLIGVSEGEREFLGVRQVAALVKSLRDEHDDPIFLNADHTHSLAKVEEAAKAGFDEIIFDGSALPFEENVHHTKRAVEAIKSINPAIVVEGEIGYIGTSSTILERVPEGADVLTTPEEAKQFVDATGIDVLAPAVGNMHGLLRSMVHGDVEKRLDIQRIKAIKEATGLWMTLHGGSGTNDEDFQQAIKAGMTIVHVNTELRLAWRRGLESALAKAPDEVTPYKILPGALEAIKEVVRARLQLFNFL